MSQRAGESQAGSGVSGSAGRNRPGAVRGHREPAEARDRHATGRSKKGGSSCFRQGEIRIEGNNNLLHFETTRHTVRTCRFIGNDNTIERPSGMALTCEDSGVGNTLLVY